VNPVVIGDRPCSEKAGRKRALKLFPYIGPCEVCAHPMAERHHKDGNTANNARGNIAALCRRCHMEADGRIEAAREMMRQIRVIGIVAAAQEKLSRTHCKRGHPLSGENLFITSGGSRGCKECRRIHSRDSRARNR